MSDDLKHDPPARAARVMRRRSPECRFTGAHVWHVIRRDRRDIPCGGER